MKVKIIKCSKPEAYWGKYAIGQEIEVKEYDEDYYIVVNNLDALKYLFLKSDCKIVVDDLKTIKFSSNDLDGAYLIGVFNTSGLDGLLKEINRIKELGIMPHKMFELIKKQG